MNICFKTHHLSPLLAEAMQREVRREHVKIFKLFRERGEKKGPFVLQPSPFLNVSHFNQHSEEK